jgi:hypothetical protein
MAMEKRSRKTLNDVKAVRITMSTPSKASWTISVNEINIMRNIMQNSIPAMRLEFLSVMKPGLNLSLSKRKNSIVRVDRIMIKMEIATTSVGLSRMKRYRNLLFFQPFHPMPSVFEFGRPLDQAF